MTERVRMNVRSQTSTSGNPRNFQARSLTFLGRPAFIANTNCFKPPRLFSLPELPKSSWDTS